MASTRKLSSDEVNALIEGLGSETSESIASLDVGDMADVRPFKFGSDDLSLLGDYYALRMINERFARFARSVFLPICFKISILIYLDRKVPISASNNITNNVKSISVSYKDYEDFQEISKVIITKLIES